MFIQYSTTLFGTWFFVQISNFTTFFLAYQKFQNYVLSPRGGRLQGTRTRTGDMSISTLQWWLCFPICVSIYIYIYITTTIDWFTTYNLLRVTPLVWNFILKSETSFPWRHLDLQQLATHPKPRMAHPCCSGARSGVVWMALISLKIWKLISECMSFLHP